MNELGYVLITQRRKGRHKDFFKALEAQNAGQYFIACTQQYAIAIRNWAKENKVNCKIEDSWTTENYFTSHPVYDEIKDRWHYHPPFVPKFLGVVMTKTRFINKNPLPFPPPKPAHIL